jgi:hypothetical protein
MRVLIGRNIQEIKLRTLHQGDYFTIGASGGVFRRTDCFNEKDKPYCVCVENGQLLWFHEDDKVQWLELVKGGPLYFCPKHFEE